MAVGDIVMEDKEYGLKEVACPECLGAIVGYAPPDCPLCDGSGVMFELIAPRRDVEAAIANVSQQIAKLQQES